MPNKRVMLINMPFSARRTPAIGLSLLKAALIRDGISCDMQYFNIAFASLMGSLRYDQIAEINSVPLLGEWLFAAELFGDLIPPPEEYLAMISLPSSDLNSPETSVTWHDTELLEIRKQTGAFLDQCMEAVDWHEYMLVGFTTTFEQNTASLALARRLKERYPHLVIVFGGSNCEGEMGASLHRLFPFIDYVCSGEGDINFPILVRKVLEGKQVGEIAGMIRRENGQTILPAESNASVKDMDALPYPDYEDFMTVRKELNLWGGKGAYLLVETARGCWWGQKSQCIFCGLNGTTMQFRSKSPARAVEEISYLSKHYSVQNIFAVDNIIDMGFFHDVLPRLKDLNPPVNFFYETKANLRKDQVRQLSEANIVTIMPGIESLSSDILSLMRKGVTMLQNVQLLRWCAEYMIDPHWFMLAGLPGENPLEYERQAELVPMLTHLQGPRSLFFVRLDRFSPMFDHPEAHGIRNVRAAEVYRYIYPFSIEDLNGLAYTFDFDYIDPRNPASYTDNLRPTIEYWMSANNHSELASSLVGDDLMIRDTRPVAKQNEYRYTGLHRTVYEFCDKAHTRNDIKAHLVTTLRSKETIDSVLDANLEAALSDFINEKLMICDNDHFLSLAVDVSYKLQVLA